MSSLFAMSGFQGLVPDNLQPGFGDLLLRSRVLDMARINGTYTTRQQGVVRFRHPTFKSMVTTNRAFAIHLNIH